LAFAPGVEGVVDEGRPVQKTMVVRFHVKTADADGDQAPSGSVGVDVGRVDDAGQRRANAGMLVR